LEGGKGEKELKKYYVDSPLHSVPYLSFEVIAVTKSEGFKLCINLR